MTATAGARARLLAGLADAIRARQRDRRRGERIRVAVDGVDGAGKTTFADELARHLAGPVDVVRASVDSFHHPAEVRHRRGRGSPEGYFRDSYDYARMVDVLLEPLGPGGHGRYRDAVFDHRTDAPVDRPERQAGPGSILVVDGIFLHRPELAALWDLSIWLEVPFEVSVPRMAARDGGDPRPDAPSNLRYVEGQRLYLRECDPAGRATALVDNTDLGRPRLLRLTTM
jgi:uridine kinase